MNRKLAGGILFVLGIILIAVGLVLMLVVVPGMKQFPEDVDTTRMYEGTMTVMFDPSTFQFLPEMPIGLERHFETSAVDGDVALVREEQVMSSGDQVLQQFVKHYAIDRKSMKVVNDYPAAWSENEGFWDRAGLVLGWPIDTEKTDYDGWSDDYREIVPLEYNGEVEHERTGITTYYYTSSGEAKPIHPDHVATLGLPAGLPKDDFAALLEQPETELPAMVMTVLPRLLDNLEGDTVPLQYYYAYEGEYWIEPETGVLIDTRKHELRTVGLSEEVIADSPLAALPEEQRGNLRVTVSDFTYWGTDESVEEAKQDAQEAKDAIQLYGTTIPVIAIVLGAVLGIVGAFVFVRRS